MFRSIFFNLSRPAVTGDAVILFAGRTYHGKGFGGGRDAVQALLSAMQKIGMELYASEANKTGKLAWDDWKGFGFPVPPNARDLLKGDDAKFL